MRKKKPLPERAKDNSKGIVYFDPPWGQRKLPDAPAKDWSLPKLALQLWMLPAWSKKPKAVS